MRESQWFYMRDHKRVGPVGLSAMHEMLARREIRADTPVWTVGMSHFTPAGEVAALSVAHATAHVPAPASAAMPAPESATPSVAAPRHVDKVGRQFDGLTSATATEDASEAVTETPIETELPTATLAVSPPVAAAAPLAAPVAARAAALPAAPVGYYRPGGGMPPRAAENLKRHARPTGDTGDWPCDDAHVAAFAETVQVRKRVTGAAQLYRALLFLSLIVVAVLGVVLAFLFIDPPGGGRAGTVQLTTGATLVFLAGLSALYYVTWRATMRAHRWAPLTMAIVFGAGVVANVVTIAGSLGTRGDPAALVGGLVGTALAFLFAFVSLQSMLAVPKYLARPAWCQELIVKAGL